MPSAKLSEDEIRQLQADIKFLRENLLSDPANFRFSSPIWRIIELASPDDLIIPPTEAQLKAQAEHQARFSQAPRVFKDAPRSPSPFVAPASGSKSTTRSRVMSLSPISERDRSPIKSQSPAMKPKSRRSRKSTPYDKRQYKEYKERIAEYQSQSKTKSNPCDDDEYDSPPEMDVALSLDEEWEAAVNLVDSVANQLAEIPEKSDNSEDYDTVSSSSDESFKEVKGKRKKRTSPSNVTKAKKAVAKSSPQSDVPPASPGRQLSPVSDSANASQRDNRSPSPMVVVDNTATRKVPLPPPIYLQDKGKWSAISSACIERKINYSKATACQQGIRIQVPTPRDYRELTRYLKSVNASFHTYTLPEERPTRAVIRRIPKEISTEAIREDLLAQNIPVIEVHRLHKARGGQQYDMVLVVCQHTEGYHPIFGIKTICSLSGITIEKPYRPHVVGQCHNCQLYGHSQSNCYATPRCVKCLGEHSTRDCTRPKDRAECTEPPSCVLCGQVGHPANYRGCPKAPKLAPKMAKRHAARQARSHPETQPPTRLAPQRTSPWGKLNHQGVAPQSFSQPIPALMDTPIPAPILAPAAPMSTQSQKVASTTSAAKCPPPAAPSGQRSYLSVAANIIGAYSFFMTPQARALDAEIRNAGTLDPVSCNALFERYECITRELDCLIYKDGQWVRK